MKHLALQSDALHFHCVSNSISNCPSDNKVKDNKAIETQIASMAIG